MEEEVVKICVMVRKNVWEEFKQYVLNTYGSLRGYLGHEVSEALGLYLRSAHTHINREKNVFIKNVRKKHLDLLTWIARNFEFEITKSNIMKFIEDNFGIDDRTKRKYFDFLTDNGFIVYERGREDNAIYKVNYDRIVAVLRAHGVQIEKQETVSDKVNELSIYARQRYEAGDSIEEIRDKLADFGDFTKKAVRNLIRKGGLNE